MTNTLQRQGQSSALPALTTGQMVAALENYRTLQAALDRSMPDQIMDLDGKKFRKKGYWRAIALAFSLEVELVKEERTEEGAFMDGRANFGWLVSYRATNLNGRSMPGDGACFAVEKARRFKCPHRDPSQPNNPKRTEHFPHNTCPEFDIDFQWKALPGDATVHNVRGHAHTRAYNRAVSNLVGFGEVSAEEAMGREDDDHGHAGNGDTKRASSATKAAADAEAVAGTTTITSVAEKSGTNARGGWTKYTIIFADGRKGGTFDKGLGARCKELRDLKTPVRPQLESGEKGMDLTAFLPVVVAEPKPEDEPVSGPEKILTIRKVETESGNRWIIQTDKRALATDQESLAEHAAAARDAKQGLVPVFTIVPNKQEGHAPVNKLTGWQAELVGVGAREPGQEG